ncbi:MAG: murein biosynthesis integral membrane protein MurJ [Vreelandella alkaliphila]|uniref:Probable lipid II flippase MurJ n=1 Tax=Halomonas campaniensis TaxID=213554 RepID=A0A3D0KG31_9GAMM|nr:MULTISPECIES: murein biosynthesis integral membrane protein MurJ [unclassified Halomonas]HBP40702.1 murein biosynthesis integral membrane protein MurJ [Halomonas sp.]HBS83312.1 murein biosynthesis integral membrane protein MurJ [Halomonas campaniensis]ASK21700.1 murein biosynthesis integral membrane protein MurJ [Halomonas sp. N3-2A]WKD27731.1 murein biosynthesis integral membrane protein MurJ [Halomonas sp. KG2]HCA02129.1 murein biosynthesis integral membrane protein MurJ [Halomonas campan
MTANTPPQANMSPPRRGLMRSGLVVSAMTMLSRVMGLVRDVVVATFLGAGNGSDAFFVAFKIPNFLRRLFAEGAFNQAFVPVLSEYSTQRSKQEIRELLNAVAGSLTAILALITALAMLGAPWLVWVFAPGFGRDPEKLAMTADMLRLTFPYLLLISLTAFSGSVLNTWNRFAVPAFTPVLLNISLIGAALLLMPLMEEPAMALAWGVLIAGAAQLAFQVPFLLRLGLLPTPWPNFAHEGVKRILKLMAPALFGVSVSQINLLLDTVLASLLTAGSVSWLYYSDRLVELPLGVFGVAIGTIILPALSKRHAEQSTEHFSAMLDWAIRVVLLLGVPAALALAVLAEPFLITLFHYGAMTDTDIQMAAMSLRAYAFGLVAFMLIKVLAPGFFARQDTKTPVKVGIIAMVANMVFNLLLIWPLAHAGLALATALSAFLNAGLLGYLLYRQKVLIFQPGWGRYAVQLVGGSALMSIALYLAAPDWQEWLDFELWQRIRWVAGLVVLGGGLYFAWLTAFGLRLRHFKMNS